jgi:hypothetical protein
MEKKIGVGGKTIEKVKMTQVRKLKIAFGPTEVAKKPITYNECVVSFAIQIDKGNNAK